MFIPGSYYLHYSMSFRLIDLKFNNKNVLYIINMWSIIIRVKYYNNLINEIFLVKINLIQYILILIKYTYLVI